MVPGVSTVLTCLASTEEPRSCFGLRCKPGTPVCSGQHGLQCSGSCHSDCHCCGHLTADFDCSAASRHDLQSTSPTGQRGWWGWKGAYMFNTTNVIGIFKSRIKAFILIVDRNLWINFQLFVCVSVTQQNQRKHNKMTEVKLHWHTQMFCQVSIWHGPSVCRKSFVTTEVKCNVENTDKCIVHVNSVHVNNFLAQMVPYDHMCQDMFYELMLRSVYLVQNNCSCYNLKICYVWSNKSAAVI